MSAAACPHTDAVPLRLEQATTGTVGDVLAVLSDAALWLRVDKGITDQWPPVFVAGGHRATQLAEEAGQGRVHLVYRAGVPLATVTVTPWCDPDFAHGWPDTDGDALYVLRLAVTRTARAEGLELGTALLEYAADLAAEQGVRRLRLDCSRTNTALHRYYERRGFHRVGEVAAPGRRSGALFERTVPESVRGEAP